MRYPDDTAPPRSPSPLKQAVLYLHVVEQQRRSRRHAEAGVGHLPHRFGRTLDGLLYLLAVSGFQFHVAVAPAQPVQLDLCPQVVQVLLLDCGFALLVDRALRTQGNALALAHHVFGGLGYVLRHAACSLDVQA